MADESIERYGKRVSYSESEIEKLHEEGHRIRHLKRIAKAVPLYSIEAEIIRSRHCNSGHEMGPDLWI